MGIDTQRSKAGEEGWRYEKKIQAWVLEGGVTDITLEYEKKCKEKFCNGEKDDKFRKNSANLNQF